MAVFRIPILALLAVVLVVSLCMRRWRLSAGVGIVLILLNLVWQAVPLRLTDSSRAEADNTFRILTYNIYPISDTLFGEQGQQAFLEEIKQIDPDIVCLQEFLPKQRTWLDAELRNYYGYTDEQTDQQKKLRGIIYSRFPLTDVRRYAAIDTLDRLTYGAAYDNCIRTHNIRQPYYSAVAHLPGGDSVVVVSCHLQSCGYSTIRRNMSDTASWISGLKNYYQAIAIADEIRSWEARNFRQYIDSLYPEMPLIAAGDYNDFSRSKCLKIVQQDDLQDAWWHAGNGFGRTFVKLPLCLRLDHILYRPKNLRPIKINVGKSELSDHRPLTADFTLEK